MTLPNSNPDESTEYRKTHGPEFPTQNAETSTQGDGAPEPTQSGGFLDTYPQMESNAFQRFLQGSEYEIDTSSYNPALFGTVSMIYYYYIILISPTDDNVFVSLPGELDPNQIGDQRT